MPNRALVAPLVAVGLLSSTIALAAAPNSAVQNTNSSQLEAPAVVANSLTTEATVEPASQIPSDAADNAGTSAQQSVDTLAALVQQANVEALSDEEAHCLATTVYHEARSESLTGQLAVANVVLERARSGRFPTSLCGVVTQPGQFSFVKGGRIPTPTHQGQWRTAKAVAMIAREGAWANPVQGALYFHSARVAPGWKHDRVTRIGGHVFYR
jgi:N-acetylmuramoyl-L-alanine amidase